MNSSFSEHTTQLNINFINEIPNEEVKLILLNYLNSIKETKEFRNSFTHRFPKNQMDSRVTYENNTISGGMNVITSEKKIQENINFSIKILSDTILELKKCFNLEK